MFYGDFPLIPLILVITLQDRKTLLCVFLSFRIFLDSNRPRFFGALIFYHEKHQEKKKSMRWDLGAKRAQEAWSPCQAAPPMAVQALSLQRRQSSSPDAQLDLKTPIYIPPGRSRSDSTNMKHWNRGCSSEDWRGKRCRSRPRSLLHPLRR
jgi:hypothetical protein